MAWIAVVLAVVVIVAIAPSPTSSTTPADDIVGTWTSAPNALPDPQLPHVPLVGNGRIGVAVDASSHMRNVYPFPGQTNAIDLYINTNSFWSCIDSDSPLCGRDADPDHVVPACCSVAAVGGLTLYVRNHTGPLDAPPLSFKAQQHVANGTVVASLYSPTSGLQLTAVIYTDPDTATVAVNVTVSTPSPAVVEVDVLLWIVGSNTKTLPTHPAPVFIGCIDPDTATPAPCNASLGKPLALGGARAASTVPQNKTMAITAALVASISAPALSYFVASPLSDDSRHAVVGATLALSSQQPCVSIVVREGEANNTGFHLHTATADTNTDTDTDNKANTNVLDSLFRAMMLQSPESHDTTRIASRNNDFYTTFWNASSISLPSRPRVEQLWYGALAALVGFSSADPAVVAGGLYGPWATMDNPNWHGDYTVRQSCVK